MHRSGERPLTRSSDKQPAIDAATLIGVVAVLLWSCMTALTTAAGAIPPLELAAITFAIGGVLGLALTVARGRTATLRQPLTIWLLGIGGFFGDFVLFFWSLKLAPAAPASLISYLWPLFTVVMSAALPGERLTGRHAAGALLGLAGVVLLTFDQGLNLAFTPMSLIGYALALGSALTWAGYSVLSRRFENVPNDAVAGFCLGTAALAAVGHLVVEETVVPTQATQVAALFAIGVGPAGLAFFCWDIGVKKGKIRTLGVISYAIPLLSTLLLVAIGQAAPTPLLAAACLLVSAAAVLVTLRPSKRGPRTEVIESL